MGEFTSGCNVITMYLSILKQVPIWASIFNKIAVFQVSIITVDGSGYVYVCTVLYGTYLCINRTTLNRVPLTLTTNKCSERGQVGTGRLLKTMQR